MLYVVFTTLQTHTKMKTLIIFAFLAVAVLAGPTANTSGRLNVGWPYPGDRVLQTGYLTANGSWNNYVQRDFIFRAANATTRISTVRAWEVGASQRAFATIFTGGPGFSFVTVRGNSQRNQGFNFFVEIRGR